LGISENHLIVRSRHVTLYVRLIDGVFPNYKDVIPKFSSKSVRIARADFLEALRRASIVSLERFRGVRIEVTKNLLRLSSSNPDIGESEEKVEAEYVKEPFTISFNSRYLIDVLSALSADRVLIEANDETSPVVVKDEQDEGFLAVIMPMRL
jgi:DNA polymerase-3 subunit beta